MAHHSTNSSAQQRSRRSRHKSWPQSLNNHQNKETFGFFCLYLCNFSLSIIFFSRNLKMLWGDFSILKRENYTRCRGDAMQKKCGHTIEQWHLETQIGIACPLLTAPASPLHMVAPTSPIHMIALCYEKIHVKFTLLSTRMLSIWYIYTEISQQV